MGRAYTRVDAIQLVKMNVLSPFWSMRHGTYIHDHFGMGNGQKTLL